jgi:hypothetical protein
LTGRAPDGASHRHAQPHNSPQPPGTDRRARRSAKERADRLLAYQAAERARRDAEDERRVRERAELARQRREERERREAWLADRNRETAAAGLATDLRSAQPDAHGRGVDGYAVARVAAVEEALGGRFVYDTATDSFDFIVDGPEPAPEYDDEPAPPAPNLGGGGS